LRKTDAARKLAAFERPAANTTEATELRIVLVAALWEHHGLENHPMIGVASDWLEEHAPVTERIALVHDEGPAVGFDLAPATSLD
jgi:hypothetical protein